MQPCVAWWHNPQRPEDCCESRGRARTLEGEWYQGTSAGLKASSSPCDPCNIKACLPNPRQCSLSSPCIWQTSWVSAGRIQSLFVQTQSSGKCRAGAFLLCVSLFLASLRWLKAAQPTDGPPYYCIWSGTSDSASSATCRRMQLRQHSTDAISWCFLLLNDILFNTPAY